MESDDIYISVPYRPNVDENEMALIWNFLDKQNERFVTAREIALACNMPVSGTQVKVRQCITTLIEHCEVPIVSNGKGFALVSEPNVVRKYIENLEIREKGLNRRIRAMQRIQEKMLNGQLKKYAL